MIRTILRQFYRTALPLFYRRARYRLFLNTGLAHIHQRMLALASETDYFSTFVRAIPVRAPFGKSMLVVAPHQDDETIGCGGALALQVASKHSAAVVMLHDGAPEAPELGMTRKALTDLRNEESRRMGVAKGLLGGATGNAMQSALPHSCPPFCKGVSAW